MANRKAGERPTLLDPTARAAARPARPAPRPASLRGVKVSLVGNGKENCALLFDFIERWLREECAVAEVLRLDKPCYWEPMPEEVRRRVEAFGGVAITGLGS